MTTSRNPCLMMKLLKLSTQVNVYKNINQDKILDFQKYMQRATRNRDTKKVTNMSCSYKHHFDEKKLGKKSHDSTQSLCAEHTSDNSLDNKLVDLIKSINL